ncbi:MAG: hypothetical protein WC528_04055 [Patescibacteria group bacterium]
MSIPIGWLVFLFVFIALLCLVTWRVYRKPRCCGHEMREKSIKDGIRTYICPVCGREFSRLEAEPDDYFFVNRFPL